jgi:hypothetical protein
MKWMCLGICLMIFGPVTDKTGADEGPTSAQGLKSPLQPKWESLLPPEDLSGWKILGGSARYRVEDSVVIGQSTPNSPNTWLITERQFGDFELEYEFLCDPSLNSGVQIRSEAVGSGARGFQVEIDVDDQRKRFWSAGLYEEGDRGWIDDLKDNPAARAAHKPHDWNHVRVVAVGAHLQTWINGVAAAEVFDTRRLSGFIGLQVHGVGNRQDPLEIRWRGLRVRDLGAHRWTSLPLQSDQSGPESIMLPKDCSTFRIDLSSEADAPTVSILWRGRVHLDFSTDSLDYSYQGEVTEDAAENPKSGPMGGGKDHFRGRFQVFSGDEERSCLVLSDGQRRLFLAAPGPPPGGQIVLSGRRSRIRTLEALVPAESTQKPQPKGTEDVAPKTSDQ